MDLGHLEKNRRRVLWGPVFTVPWPRTPTLWEGVPIMFAQGILGVDCYRLRTLWGLPNIV